MNERLTRMNATELRDLIADPTVHPSYRSAATRCLNVLTGWPKCPVCGATIHTRSFMGQLALQRTCACEIAPAMMRDLQTGDA